jgi:hypothetical protein
MSYEKSEIVLVKRCPKSSSAIWSSKSRCRACKGFPLDNIERSLMTCSFVQGDARTRLETCQENSNWPTVECYTGKLMDFD